MQSVPRGCNKVSEVNSNLLMKSLVDLRSIDFSEERYHLIVSLKENHTRYMLDTIIKGVRVSKMSSTVAQSISVQYLTVTGKCPSKSPAPTSPSGFLSAIVTETRKSPDSLSSSRMSFHHPQ